MTLRSGLVVFLVLVAGPACGQRPRGSLSTPPQATAVDGISDPTRPGPTIPVAWSNDHRHAAGRVIAGEVVVELEALQASWQPRGSDGPRIIAPAFAEVGRPPQVPGPVIRTSVGVPVRVSVRNTLPRPITLRGLLDRATAPPPDERLFVITRWAGRDERSTLTTTFKMMINGLSWPHTERLRYSAGDTVRWRVVNASSIPHPMHLHGFYFHVDARGDTDADTVYAQGARPLAVTDVMPDFSSLRLSWVQLGVGETFDAEWRPLEPGAYTLEVVTTHYSASGLRPTVQRIAFGVGEVTEDALAAAAYIEPPPPPPSSPLDTMAVIELPEDRLRELVGAYTAPGVPVDFTVSWEEGGLRLAVTGQQPRPLVPLSPTLFRWEDEPSVRVEFEREGGRPVLVVFGMRLQPASGR